MDNSRLRIRGHRSLRAGRSSLTHHVYHVTTITRDRVPLFACFNVARAAARALASGPLLRTSTLLAWVLMPDHLHALVELGGGDSLPALVRRLKSGTALAVNRRLGTRGSVWQTAYHDHVLRRDEDLVAIARYIIANPLRAGLVSRFGDYPHWDAVWVDRDFEL